MGINPHVSQSWGLAYKDMLSAGLRLRNLVSQSLETTLGTVAQGACGRHPGGSLGSLTVLFAATSINQPTEIEHDIWQKEHSPPAGSMLLKARREKYLPVCVPYTAHSRLLRAGE